MIFGIILASLGFVCLIGIIIYGIKHGLNANWFGLSLTTVLIGLISVACIIVGAIMISGVL